MNTTADSVSISLAELAKLEQERQREEELRKAILREKLLLEQKSKDAEKARQEQARLTAERYALEQKTRQEAEIKALEQARIQATIETARIEAQSRARLDREAAQRTHQLAQLRMQTETKNRRVQYFLSFALGLVLVVGALGSYVAISRINYLERTVEQLRVDQSLSKQNVESARKSEFAFLDRLQSSLFSRAVYSRLDDDKLAVSMARRRIGDGPEEPAKLEAFANSLDNLGARLVRLDRLAALDRRFQDLSVWANQRGSIDLNSIRNVAAKAKDGQSDSALQTYEWALERLRDTLSQQVGKNATRLPLSQQHQEQGSAATDECPRGDPLCGLSSRR
jgi:hypothetical protein